MSEFTGNAVPGARARRTMREDPLRDQVVEGRILPVSPPDVQPHEQLAATADDILPVPQRVRTDGQGDLCPFPSPVCPICRGAGQLRKHVPVGHPDFGKAHPCECKKREQREKHRQRMIELCARFGFQREQVLATFRRQVKGVQEAYQEACSMADCLQTWAGRRDGASSGKKDALPEQWLVLRGPVGTGKSHLAMAITHACIDAGMVALFATVPDLLDYLRGTYDPHSPVTYDALFPQLRDAELLVLDDLGAQRSSAWADEKLFQLLNYRYNFGWPTVITINTRSWSYLEERIRSRLQDARLVTLVNMADAQDYRLHQGQNTSRRGIPEAERSPHHG